MSDWDNDPFIERVANELRHPIRVDSRFDDRVMAALEAPTVIPLRPIARTAWLRRRWTISVSPMGGLAAAAAIGAIAILGMQLRTPVTEPPLARTQGTSLVAVANSPIDVENVVIERQLTLLAPNATKVAVVGDFNDWDATRGSMQRLTADGLWSVTLPLRVGRHEYQFVVDDTLRLPDPTMPQASSDFGSANSVITVGPRHD
ncbi:MAG: 1,4-alpha-glucan branching enzyme GlgB [Gemmatimonadaceae bacterium]|nr:1,4-alpha-glucan branching enzyme GlgB [Gemmatimonadaceae bacterium]